jgi:hypothetical protein
LNCLLCTSFLSLSISESATQRNSFAVNQNRHQTKGVGESWRKERNFWVSGARRFRYRLSYDEWECWLSWKVNLFFT